jgi:type IV pilus assembly protein PilB
MENSRTRARIRFRIDGVLYEVMTPRQELYPAIVSRLKVMANLDIAERRMPQDGRIQVATQGRTVDLRFSSLPGLFGEKIVLRVLDKNQSILDVEKLALSPDNLGRFKGLLARSHGLILVTGPTGSGKTTTLYAAINHLKSIEKNIVTIEDPVEFQLDIINQNQTNDAIGLTFPKVLKHVLRQDPDIIMVGEIRDQQTAEIAVQAALTGHLVLSTLHTNDALGAVSRMIDMGVEPYLLSSALIGVMAQRLVRRICGECKTNYLAPPEVVATCGWPKEGTYQLARGRGCPACYDSGYKGRVAIHELLKVDDKLQSRIVRKAGADELRAYAQESGHRGLYADGMERVRSGLTTPEEISRAIHSQ